MSAERQKMISVIVPVYNVEKYMSQCINNLINQTYKNIEIILVDDGSTDSSGKRCDEYAGQDDRIVVIHKENGGLSDARNVALEMAQGELLTFVDSDDVVDLDYCEMLYKSLNEQRADISVCNTVLFRDNVPTQLNKKGIQIFKNGKIVEAYLKCLIQPMACGKIYKKSLFHGIRYPKGKTTEDVYVIVELLKKCGLVVVGADTNYYYRQRRDSIQHSSKINIQNVIAAHEHNYELLKGSQYEDLAYERYLLSYQDALNMLIRNNNEDERVLEYIRVLSNNKKRIINSALCSIKRKMMLRQLFLSRFLYTKIYSIHIKRMFSKLT